MIKLSQSQQGILSGLLTASYTVKVYRSAISQGRALLMPENTIQEHVPSGDHWRVAFRVIPKTK